MARSVFLLLPLLALPIAAHAQSIRNGDVSGFVFTCGSATAPGGGATACTPPAEQHFIVTQACSNGDALKLVVQSAAATIPANACVKFTPGLAVPLGGAVNVSGGSDTGFLITGVLSSK
jgi:hypothetical protein